ncbi:tRNA (5-methylaminomethyl-2-thiouridine)(34)-methyltransferase MnmD [Jannaschia sp. LMIT008]|uniref:tRNA (5-methylaminomethyl-2-thiouridine)(34)-methyltransferase MnmD n=1 Tax=Jannaschia maritima TaxID=3032585 RepID=UPI0028115D4C|nr:tRNA (5-methylaminomethyl-2-thiouridine)(34)-methyltransferase MnmD [Jannaschia sp. LMIT008]
MDVERRNPSLDWKDGVPVASAFGDPYYSLQDGVAETRHVFLSGNDLPARFRDGFHVAELGFGTGLNFAVTIQAFRAAAPGRRLRYTAFEAFPLHPGDRARALGAFPDLPDPLPPGWDGIAPVAKPDFDLMIVPGHADATLPDWDGWADAWFLDGFAPARNPDLWTPALMADVAAHTAPGGTFATYTAAGHVRRALAAGGFAVERIPGFGRKRHMTRGRLR